MQIEDQAELEAIAREAAPEVYGKQFETISQYVDILLTRGLAWGLIGPREPERIWSRPILNCAALESLLPQGIDMIDVGSGAGLPGLPLAILRPDLTVTLVESLERRANFLRLAVEELGLGGCVQVVRGRAEEQKLTADIVTCRAVAPLEKLLKWTSSYFLPHGSMVALKGERAESDVKDAARELERRKLLAEVLTVRAHQRTEPTQAVIVRKAR